MSPKQVSMDVHGKGEVLPSGRQGQGVSQWPWRWVCRDRSRGLCGVPPGYEVHMGCFCRRGQALHVWVVWQKRRPPWIYVYVSGIEDVYTVCFLHGGIVYMFQKVTSKSNKLVNNWVMNVYCHMFALAIFAWCFLQVKYFSLCLVRVLLRWDCEACFRKYANKLTKLFQSFALWLFMHRPSLVWWIGFIFFLEVV